MNTRLICVALAILVFSAAGFAQGFAISLNNYTGVGPATTQIAPSGACGGAAYPDGTMIYVYQDFTFDGLSADDALADVGENAGQVNFNSFQINSQAYLEEPGHWVMDPVFTSVGMLPPNPYYYIVLFCPGSGPASPQWWERTQWHSVTYYWNIPGPQDLSVTEATWLCQPCACCGPCEATPSVTISYPEQQAIQVCEGSSTVVNFVGYPGMTSCDVRSFILGLSSCDGPSQATFDPLAWSFDPATYTYSNVIYGVIPGCVLISVDLILSPPPIVRFDPASSEPQSNCQAIGWGNYDLPCIGPFSPGDYPMLVERPGCNADNPCNTENLPPPDGYTSELFFYPNLGYYFWYGNPTGEMGGYVCLSMEFTLAVELTSFTATPRDGAVQLAWVTASETGNDRFEIQRDGVTLAHVPSQGSGAGHSYTWTDDAAANGTTYHYTLFAVDATGHRDELAARNATPNPNGAVITEYALHQNYPNPFNPSTTITFDLVGDGHVDLRVYNLMGQEVAEPVNGNGTAGRHTIRFDASDLPSGLYFYRLDVNGYTATHKMMLMK